MIIYITLSFCIAVPKRFLDKKFLFIEMLGTNIISEGEKLTFEFQKLKGSVRKKIKGNIGLSRKVIDGDCY